MYFNAEVKYGMKYYEIDIDNIDNYVYIATSTLYFQKKLWVKNKNKKKKWSKKKYRDMIRTRNK